MQVVIGMPAPNVPLGQAIVDAQILDPGGEAFVEPQIRPPILLISKETCRIVGTEFESL